MQLPKILCVHGTRVLTTRHLAIMYGTEPEIINNNFARNKTKYVLEKHYLSIDGEEMKQLKTSHQFDGELKRVSRAYFWTEKGALLHAKSLNTDKAWEVYDYLVDYYFRAEEKKVQLVQAPALPAPQEKPKQLVVDVPRNVEAQRLIRKMRRYLMGLEAVLDAYDAYHKAEDFKGVCGTLMDISAYTTKVAFQLSEFKPNMIERT